MIVSEPQTTQLTPPCHRNLGLTCRRLWL